MILIGRFRSLVRWLVGFVSWWQVMALACNVRTLAIDLISECNILSWLHSLSTSGRDTHAALLLLWYLVRTLPRSFIQRNHLDYQICTVLASAVASVWQQGMGVRRDEGRCGVC